MSDPWDRPSAPSAPQPGNRMRCDPRQPLPKLDPKQWSDVALKVALAAKKVIVDPAIAGVDAVAAAAERERQQTDQMIREAIERKRRENSAKGYPPEGPRGDGMGTPKPIENRPLARERVEFLEAQLYNAQKTGDTERAQRVANELAWLKYDLQMADNPSNNNSSGNNSATVPSGGDRPRSDGLQGENPGGAPLEPPPGNTAPPPPRRPIPPPDRPRPAPHPGGPFRTPGR